jgi:hypothetical protein
MDKATMLLGLILIATPLVVLTLGIGWLMDDIDNTESDIEGQHDTDSDLHSDVHIGIWSRRSDNRHDNRMGKGDRE